VERITFYDVIDNFTVTAGSSTSSLSSIDSSSDADISLSVESFDSSISENNPAAYSLSLLESKCHAMLGFTKLVIWLL